MRCLHQIDVPRLAPSRNALRIETQHPEPRCAARPKRDARGNDYDVLRWVYSGGSPVTVARECVGRESPNCPLSSSDKNQ